MTKKFEGFRAQPYTDTTGHQSIGYGFNMAAHPDLPKKMNEDVANRYFAPYYQQAVGTAQRFAGDHWDNLNDDQKSVLSDMAYNMHDKIFQFKKMQADIQQGNMQGAGQEMQNSNWFNQVGQRGPSDVSTWAGQ